ncbi:MAG: formate dehydrogenase accessory sulfurtransferase FdhD [Polaromonas sp.]|nr:formate dehydrogenase accessory sulfurtransferase FdhD [Polaromonas sp.]
MTQEVHAINEFGESLSVSIPAERALTLYVDKRELVTLMTLGARPEWLVLGYLRNQRLVAAVEEVESVTVDWDVGAAAVKTYLGIEAIDEKTSRRIVTTGCGQGSVFGGLMDDIGQIELSTEAAMSQSQLYALVNTIRLKESTYKSAGSVHACALFALTAGDPELLLFVEDVGRHNAIDAIAGWMWLQQPPTPSTLQVAPTFAFYTTGRLTSEMIIKSAQMGVSIVVSRSGITQMGYDLAQSIGLCAIGRATNRRFFCYSGSHRLRLQPELAGAKSDRAADGRQ